MPLPMTRRFSTIWYSRPCPIFNRSKICLAALRTETRAAQRPGGVKEGVDREGAGLTGFGASSLPGLILNDNRRLSLNVPEDHASHMPGAPNAMPLAR